MRDRGQETKKEEKEIYVCESIESLEINIIVLLLYNNTDMSLDINMIVLLLYNHTDMSLDIYMIVLLLYNNTDMSLVKT